MFEKEMRFIVQSDGPSPMKPTTVGFDDDDDDDEEDEDVDVNDSNSKSQPNKGSNDKEENDGDEQNGDQKAMNDGNGAESKEDGAKSGPHIVNGRDLNAPLCSDDDDTDDGEDLDPSDKIICQFTKVFRKKNEWSVELKHGLMHINGKDYAFQKAVGGSFVWK